MPLYALIIWAIFTNILTISSSSAAEENSLHEHWLDVGMSFEHLKSNIINDDICNRHPSFNLKCIYSINKVLLRQEDSLIFLPSIFSTDPVQQSSQLKQLKKKSPLFDSRINSSLIISNDGALFSTTKLPLILRPDEMFKSQKEFELEVLQLWLAAIDSKQIKKISFDNLANIMESQITNNSSDSNYSLIMGSVLSIDSFLTTIYKDHTRIEPYSYYNRSIKETKSKSKFYGIGVMINKTEQGLSVADIVHDGPSFGKLKKYDLITHVDNDDISKLDIKMIHNKIVGKKNTPITLTIKRQNNIIKKTIIRNSFITYNVIPIVLPSTNGDNIGYIKLASFAKEGVADDVKLSLQKLIKKDVKSLVLDLRGNPGGFLYEAVEIANLFLEKNKLVTMIKTIIPNRFGKYELSYLKTEKNQFTNLPLVVLIDADSASASELVAGALRDHKRAIIIGERSFGKGTVQSQLEYRYLTKVIMWTTIARFYQPNGMSNQLLGISPHIEITNPFKPKEVVSIREDDYAIFPVEADGEHITPAISLELFNCIKNSGQSEKLYGTEEFPMTGDLQLLVAMDIAACNNQ